jgi:hypothetical protein
MGDDRMATATATPNKTNFVKEFLQGNPQANAKAVNEAWQAAGFDGTISHPTVSEVRKELGLIGTQPGKTRKAAKGKSATGATKKAARDQGKTTFVREFLGENPQGNLQAVNDAWTAAGKDGSIGSTLIQKVRSQLGLTGNLRATSKPKAATKKKVTTKKKAATKEPETVTATHGKTMFVKEFLNDHPEGNGNDVNEAWTAAGFEGTISRTLVDKTRALLGLTGNLRGSTKKPKEKAPYTGKKRGRKPKETTPAVNGQPRGRKSNRSLALDELEAEIDRLIYKAMGIGDLSQIEDSLRQTRRLLYVSANGK